eukprot:scpid102587/ scgid30319/ 
MYVMNVMKLLLYSSISGCDGISVPQLATVSYSFYWCTGNQFPTKHMGRVFGKVSNDLGIDIPANATMGRVMSSSMAASQLSEKEASYSEATAKVSVMEFLHFS